jgi:hypothetical protein
VGNFTSVIWNPELTEGKLKAQRNPEPITQNPDMKLNAVIPIRKANFIEPSRASMYSEISNSKHQIPNKSQISISKDPNRFVILNFGHCDLFVV